MRRFNMDSARIANPPGGGRWQPVRFISVCAAGHLCEFPWKEWIGCQCTGDGDLILTDRGGSELSSIKVECRSCPPGSSGRIGRDLAGTTVKPDEGEQSAFQGAGINCPGDRPWLGEGAAEPSCNQPLVGALINQTNIYFPRTLSAIALPDIQIQDDAVLLLRTEIEQDTGSLGIARTLWNMGNRAGTIALIQAGLNARGIASAPEQVEAVLENLFAPATATLPSGAAAPTDPESEILSFRRAEFNIIRNEVTDPEHVPNLRIISANVPSDLTPWFDRVNLVERLRETRVFYGFDRLEPSTAPLAGMPEVAIRQPARLRMRIQHCFLA